MYLRELRIHGFKSFADNTQLLLEPGVTAIVGPNGCGKSNIADAIRWVLGEQSSKSLRAGAMQDVIFQGTTHRKPLNLCEVSLLFTDCEAQLGTSFKEVEVARRVTRDGGSDYFINGKSCRLKDIQRLFLDTGVGQVSYSFMLQGQIDQVLSSNPSERRLIFEEAAGISRYKAQRREALSKLEGVEVNLARITDVMEEVNRRIGSLRRQASKALRYKRIRHRLTHLELAQTAHRHQQLKAKEAETGATAEGLRTKVLRTRGGVEDRERAVSEKRESRSRLSERLQQAQQNVFELRSQRDQATAKAEMATARARDHTERLAVLRHDIEALISERDNLVGKAEAERKAREAQMELFGDSGKAFEQKQAELAEAGEMLAQAEQELARARQALLMKESGVTRLRSNCTTLEVDLTSYQSRHSSLLEEIRQANEELELLKQQQAELYDAREARLRLKQAGEEELAELREHLDTHNAQYRSEQAAIQATDRDLATLIAKAAVLEDLQRKMEGFSEGAKAILKGKLSDAAPVDRCQLVMAQLEVEGQWAPAVELLLGSAVDSIALQSLDDLPPIVRALESKKLGRACLVAPMPAVNADEPEPKQGLTTVLNVVKAKSKEYQPLIANLFGGCYISPSLEDFLKHWGSEERWSFDLVATLDGCLIDGRGLIFGGQGSGSGNSFLKRDSQIRQMKLDCREMELRLAGEREAALATQERVKQVEQNLELHRRRLAETGEELSAIQAQERGINERLTQAMRRAEVRQKDLQQLDTSRKDSETRLAKAAQELEETERAIAAAREQISAAEERVNYLRSHRESRREGFDTLRMDVAEKKQRLELLQRGLDELDRRVKELANQRARKESETTVIEQQLEGLARESEEQQQYAEKLGQELAQAHAVVEERRDALTAVEREIKSIEEGLSQQREELDKRISELNQLDVTVAKQRSELEFLIEEARKEHNLDITRVDWRRELWQAGDELPARMHVDLEDDEPLDAAIPEAPPPTPADLERMQQEAQWPVIDGEIKTLRSRIDSMGPVNLIAIEEYKELKERHEFLKAQSDDLWQAKDLLLKAIDEINKTSAELFRNTFDQIRKNFHYTFETLFGGGESDLVLVDNEDVLESGIEISARPPGTKLRTIALLSGGQKTMTAVALLFAIYMVKPSPFCVLDEIDAPLDDANIGRFTKMLESFLAYSQFVIISHNKRTIAAADTIYGVTMQERGVSRVISMRFDRKHEKLESSAEGAAAIQLS